MVYAFIYSKREGTRAAVMPEQIDENIKSERMSRLLDLQCAISKQKNEPYIGRTVRVLVDAFDKNGGENCYSARTMTNKLVHFNSERDCIGEFKSVKITRVGAFDLFGEEI
jgi:tRNA-2-methylthio-N6-dimethylallyladenosine synthase